MKNQAKLCVCMRIVSVVFCCVESRFQITAQLFKTNVCYETSYEDFAPLITFVDKESLQVELVGSRQRA